MESRPPCDLPRSNVGIYKSQFIKEFPKLKGGKKKKRQFSIFANNQNVLHAEEFTGHPRALTDLPQALRLRKRMQ